LAAPLWPASWPGLAPAWPASLRSSLFAFLVTRTLVFAIFVLTAQTAFQPPSFGGQVLEVSIELKSPSVVLERLRRLDDVAHVLFASVYLRVGDVDRLVEEIQRLKALKQLEAESEAQIELIPIPPERSGQR